MELEKLFKTNEELESFVENTKCSICERTIKQTFIGIGYVKTDKSIFVCFDCFTKSNNNYRKENIERLIDKIESETGLDISDAHKYRLKKIYDQFGFSIVDEGINRGLFRYYQYRNFDSFNEMMYKLGGICYNISQEQYLDDSDIEEDIDEND